MMDLEKHFAEIEARLRLQREGACVDITIETARARKFCRAMIDTGASATMVPLRTAHIMGLLTERSTPIHLIGGTAIAQCLNEFDVVVGGHSVLIRCGLALTQDTLVLPEPDMILLGRDALSGLVLVYDGDRAQFTLEGPRKAEPLQLASLKESVG